MNVSKKLVASVVVVFLTSACGSGSVNDNIRIAKGETRDGGARSVNGNIVVGSDAVLQGDISAVNGNIDMDERAKAGNVKSINGSIRMGEKAIAGDIDSVNGGLRMRPGASAAGIRLVNGSLEAGQGSNITGDVFLVNGTAEFFGATVGGNLETYSGNMLITDASKVAGSILVKKPKGTFSNEDKPRIIIGPESVVEGGIVAEREIRLFVHESAQVGTVTGAEAETFSGSARDIL